MVSFLELFLCLVVSESGLSMEFQGAFDFCSRKSGIPFRAAILMVLAINSLSAVYIFT